MPTVKVLLAGAGGRPGQNILASFQQYHKDYSEPHNVFFEITVLKRSEPHDSELDDDEDAKRNTIYVSDFANTSDLSAQISKANPDIIVSALNAEPAPVLDNYLLDAILQHLSSSNTSQTTSGNANSCPLPLLFINGYTLDLLHPDVKRILNATQYAILEPKLALAQRLATISKDTPSFAYTTVIPAAFLDYCLLEGHLGINIEKRTATLYDTGTKVITGCSLRFVGDAVVAIALRHLSATDADPGPSSVRNQRVRIAETFFTGRDLLDVVEECLGNVTGERRGERATFEVSTDSSADMLKQGRVIAYLNWSEFSRASTFTEDGLEFDEDGYLAFKRRTLRAICKEAIFDGLDGEKDFTLGL